MVRRTASLVLLAGCATAPVVDDDGPVDDTPGDTEPADPTETDTPADDAPAHKTLHRLNRRELDRTLADVLGVDLAPAARFPSDDIAAVFDNDADVLVVSPVLVELWAASLRDVVRAALHLPVVDVPTRFDPELDPVTVDGGTLAEGFGWSFTAPGSLAVAYDARVAGRYRVDVAVAGIRTDADPLRFALDVDGVEVATFASAGATRFNLDGFSAHVALDRGPHTVRLRYLDEAQVDVSGRPRTLEVDHLTVVGPDVDDNPVRSRHLVCVPEGWTPDVDVGRSDWRAARELPEAVCTQRVLAPFLRHAWRRPPTADEVTRLVRAVLDRPAGRSWDAAVEDVFVAALLSPHFLFRVEVPSDPTSIVPEPLTDHELAARLSYFLWATTPDERLLDLADAGRLHEPEVLAREVRRMLGDPKVEGFVQGFGDRFTSLARLDEARPDPDRYPQFDEGVRASMVASMRAFVRSFVETDRPLTDLLLGDTHAVDARLAPIYGLPPGSVDGLEEIDVAALGRVGVLGHPAWLATQAKPYRTAPILRGKWVLKHLLCDEPDAPPVNVPPLDEDALAGLSQRELIELHASNPACAGCHAVMDPVGFALEGFDAIGQARTEDGGQPIDTTGTLPGGRAFTGPLELAALLAEDPAFPACLAEHVGSYALGRTLDADDAATVTPWVTPFVESGHRLEALVLAIVTSEAFLTKVGEREAAP